MNLEVGPQRVREGDLGKGEDVGGRGCVVKGHDPGLTVQEDSHGQGLLCQMEGRDGACQCLVAGPGVQPDGPESTPGLRLRISAPLHAV